MIQMMDPAVLQRVPQAAVPENHQELPAENHPVNLQAAVPQAVEAPRAAAQAVETQAELLLVAEVIQEALRIVEIPVVEVIQEVLQAEPSLAVKVQNNV